MYVKCPNKSSLLRISVSSFTFYTIKYTVIGLHVTLSKKLHLVYFDVL